MIIAKIQEAIATTNDIGAKIALIDEDVTIRLNKSLIDMGIFKRAKFLSKIANESGDSIEKFTIV